MANYIATTEQFTATADAIREKTGSSADLEWDASTGYADDIAAIQTGVDTSDATAAAGDILSGKTAYVDGSKVTGTIATKTASNLSASGKTVTVPAGYYASKATKSVATGSATAPSSISGISATLSAGTNTLTLSKTVSVTPKVSAGYVASGTAGNSSVSLSASVTTKAASTITPGTTDQTISSGQYLTGAQTIKGDANLVSANIASGVSIFGVTGSHQGGTDTSDATAVADDILSGKTAYVDGEKITGTISTKTSSDLTASGATVTVPAGYYASQATKSISTGSATAPLIIRGNSATISTGTNTLTLSKTIAVTPSVSAGYVSSGTAGDSSVSLTASIPVIDTATITPTTSDQTISAGTYIKGTQTIKGDANLVSDNIASGVSIFGVTGSHQSGTDTSDATAVANDILYGKTAYVDGSKITGTIATKTSSDLTASGATVTVPAGYYASQATKSISTGTAAAPSSISGSSATVSTGTNTLTLSKIISIRPTVSAGYISSGTASNSSVSLTASVTTKAAATITPTTSDQTIASGTYLTGAQTIKGDANLVSANIASGVSIFGVTGSHQSGTDTSDATAAAGDILSGKTAYVDGEKITGTIATKTASNLSASGATVTVPAGYYASKVTKSVATGSATAPSSISGSSATVSTGTNTLTLTKTVSVTPSVSAGYVSSGTAGNSSVSLTASVPIKDADTIIPTTGDRAILAGVYLAGEQTIKGDANLKAENIKSGVSIFGVAGSYKGPIIITSQPTSVTGTTGQQVSTYVIATGTGLKYQWYAKGANSNVFITSSVKSNTVVVNLTSASSSISTFGGVGATYYCKITDSNGNSVYTNSVVIRNTSA